jgi:WD40 repeat protein
MFGRCLFSMGTAVGLAVALVPAQAPKTPTLAPNVARLDQTITGLDGPGSALAHNEAFGFLAVGGEAGTIQLWNQDVLVGVRKGDRPANVWDAHRGPVLSLATAKVPVLTSAGADRQIIFWSILDGRKLHTLSPETLVRCLALAPDGTILAGGGDDGAVRLWEVASGKQVGVLKEGSDWLACLAFSADGKRLTAAGFDGRVRMWDRSDGKKIMEGPVPAKPAPKSAVVEPLPALTALALSPDEKVLAVGGADGVVHLLHASDGKVLRSMTGHGSVVTSLAFHSSGSLLVSASKDRAVRLWNPANGQLIKALEGHASWVQGVAFVAHGTRLASVGADRTVRLWDLTGK